MTEEKTEDKKDLYTQVTEKFIADLEKGMPPWQQPWTNDKSANVGLPVRLNGVRYRGINALLLWAESAAKGYASPIWISYDQAIAQGGHVRRGERGAMIVAAARDTSEGGEQTPRNIPILKRYTVFNAEQINGLPVDGNPAPLPQKSQLERVEGAEAFIRATGAVLCHGGDNAFYDDSSDVIQLPVIESFPDPETYYAISLRELVHWTKHQTRLDRNCGQKQGGDEGDTAEALVAEIGAAFLCAELGMTPVFREDHSAQIGHWLAILKEDNRAIFRAAGQAQSAADYLTRPQPKQPQRQPDAQPAPQKSAESENTAAAPTEAQGPQKKVRRRRVKQDAAAPQ